MKKRKKKKKRNCMYEKESILLDKSWRHLYRDCLFFLFVVQKGKKKIYLRMFTFPTLYPPFFLSARSTRKFFFLSFSHNFVLRFIFSYFGSIRKINCPFFLFGSKLERRTVIIQKMHRAYWNSTNSKRDRNE